MKKTLFTTIILLTMTACASSAPQQGVQPQQGGETQQAEETKQSADITVFDTDEYSLKITSFDMSDLDEPTIFTAEANKTADKMYVFCAESSFIDGIDEPTLWQSELEAGTEQDGAIAFYTKELKTLGMEKITDIELTLSVYENAAEGEPLETTTIHVYPDGEENAARFMHKTAGNEQLLIDTPEAKATVVACNYDSLGEYSVWLYLENFTDTEMMFTSSDEYINGRKAEDPAFSWAVPAQRSSYTRITWYVDELKNIDVTAVDEISLVMRAYDNTDLEKPDYAKEEVVILPAEKTAAEETTQKQG